MQDFCANYHVCAINRLQDPNSLPNNGFFPVAQWYGSFVTYLFFQDIWVSFGVTSIIMALRYALLTVLLWAKFQFVYDLVIYKNHFVSIDYSDIWVGVVLILSGILIAFYLSYILSLPLIVRDPWTLYDKIVAQQVPVSIKPANSRNDYFWLKLKYYAFVTTVQYAGTLLMFLLGLLSERSLEYAIVLYFILQVLLIVLYTAFGYNNDIEKKVIWKDGLLRYAMFVLFWSLIFMFIYGSVFILRDYSVVIVLMTVTLILTVIMVPLVIIRFFVTQSK